MSLSEFTLRRRVAFHETDSAGIVHFSVYFRYMEEAEHALWREAGLSIATRVADVGFPRVAASFEYLKPLRFDDEFDARVRVVAIADKSIRYACTLTRGADTIATGCVTVVCVEKKADGTMKARSIPLEIVSHFAVTREAGE